MIELHNIDCMEYLATCQDKEFDLAIVDPQYGLGEDKGKPSRNRYASVEYMEKDWDNEPMSVEYFQELQRVCKKFIIWGANHFIDRVPIASPCWIVWDKENGDSHFADCELALTNFDTAVRVYRYRWAGMLQGDMKNKETRIHPTQKPVKLYQWILRNYAKEGQRILDTHLGSGSSAIAAHYFGFEFVGCEIDPDYFEAAKERFNNETKQVTLFT